MTRNISHYPPNVRLCVPSVPLIGVRSVYLWWSSAADSILRCWWETPGPAMPFLEGLLVSPPGSALVFIDIVDAQDLTNR